MLPYLGAVGSLRAAPVDAHTAYDLPAAPPDPAYAPTADDAGRLPNALIRPVLGTRLLHVHLVAWDDGASRGKNSTVKTPTGVPSWGALAGWPVRYLAAVNQRAYFWGLLADGAAVPAGSYKMVVSALRILGDGSAVEDWDIVETVPFSLRYAHGTAPGK